MMLLVGIVGVGLLVGPFVYTFNFSDTALACLGIGTVVVGMLLGGAATGGDPL